MSQELIFDIPTADAWNNISWCIMGELMIVHYFDGDVGDARFDALLEAIRSAGVNYILTGGIGSAKIHSVQRKKAAEVVQGIRIVSLVESAITRGFITAFSWLGIDAKGFAPSRIADAIEYLGAPDLVTENVIQAFNSLQESSKPPSS